MSKRDSWRIVEWCDKERIAELEAELADLRASSVVFKVRCDLGVTDNARGEWVHRDDCPYGCDNGWQLAEGVELMECVTSHDHEAACGSMYLIPARLIDGEES